MEAYPLRVRPLPDGTTVAPIVDLRQIDVDLSGLGGLSPWPWCVEYARRAVAAHRGVDSGRLFEESIKGFDADSGTDQEQLARVLAALDDERAVAFYGWWPTAELAGVTDILGVDAMEVPTPDRKGFGLVDGHAVVAVGYGRHDAFPGSGYLIVRNPWADVGWGDNGYGYLPFTYVRAYAIALRTFRRAAERRGDSGVSEPLTMAAGADRLAAGGAVGAAAIGIGPGDQVDRVIAQQARCYDPRSAYTDLFFSESPVDIARAKAICTRCAARMSCLSRAVQRGEPYGVWGGEFLLDGRIVPIKRGRGRPRKVPVPAHVDEITGVPVVA